MTGTGRPVLGFVGIHAGNRVAQPVSQNETLALLFERIGYRARRASSLRRPFLRSLHQVLALLIWGDVEVVVVAVFSGRSFWMADYATFLARHVRRRKIILFLHGGSLPTFGPAHRRWVTRVFRRADVILAPSDYLADVFRAWNLEVGTIPNVLAIDRYCYDERTVARPALLWMRTFQDVYDPLLALEVLHRVRIVHPDVTMTMGGADHGALDTVRTRATELGLDGCITFAGYLDSAGKARAFADHDLFLNTNRIDNMPVSVLEAAASGLVPVATAVGGIPALLTDGVDSRLVPVADADAMAAAVLDLLGDPSTFARLSVGARATAERSGWAAIQKRWETELHRLLPGEWTS